MILRSTLLVLTLLAFATDVHAQVRPEVGLRAGGALAQLRGKDDVFGKNATDRRAGLAVGLYVEMPLTSRFSVQPELLYVQKGGKTEDTFTEDEVEATLESRYKLQYLEVPVLVKYAVPMQGPWRPSVSAGPYVAYSLGRDLSFDLSSDGEDLGLSIDADEIFSRWDYGVSVGADVAYRFTQRTATIGLRYDLGLANVFQDDALLDFEEEGEAVADPTARTHQFSVVLGMRLF